MISEPKATQSAGSAARSVLIRVRELEATRSFYSGCLGLQCVGEVDAISDDLRQLWGLATGRVRCARFAKPGDAYGMIDLIEWEQGSDELIRDSQQPFAYGWFTVNHKTNELRRAHDLLADCGAQLISDAQNYEAGGKQISEVMIELATGERCTILQVGATDAEAAPFGQAAAAVGAIVPSIAASLPFYRDVLGLRVAVTIDERGAPFTTIIGAPPETHLQVVLLAGETWTGKLELLQIDLPERSGALGNANARADGRHNGYWMVSVMTADLDAFAHAARKAGAEIVRGALAIDRPFVGLTRALIARAPGGELFEVCANPT